MASKRSRRERLMSTIRGLQALAKNSGKGENAFIPLKTIYKVMKVDKADNPTTAKADIRGILNRDHIKGTGVFERCPAKTGMKRSGAYRLGIPEPEQNLDDILSKIA